MVFPVTDSAPNILAGVKSDPCDAFRDQGVPFAALQRHARSRTLAAPQFVDAAADPRLSGPGSLGRRHFQRNGGPVETRDRKVQAEETSRLPFAILRFEDGLNFAPPIWTPERAIGVCSNDGGAIRV